MTQPMIVFGLMIGSISRIQWNPNSIDFMNNYSEWVCEFTNLPEGCHTVCYVWAEEDEVSESVHGLV